MTARTVAYMSGIGELDEGDPSNVTKRLGTKSEEELEIPNAPCIQSEFYDPENELDCELVLMYSGDPDGDSEMVKNCMLLSNGSFNQPQELFNSSDKLNLKSDPEFLAMKKYLRDHVGVKPQALITLETKVKSPISKVLNKVFDS